MPHLTDKYRYQHNNYFNPIFSRVPSKIIFRFYKFDHNYKAMPVVFQRREKPLFFRHPVQADYSEFFIHQIRVGTSLLIWGPKQDL